MDHRQIEIVQKTWKEVEMVADQASTVFYARLFAIDPESASLFAATDMRQQREKLMITLRKVVDGLNDFRRLQPEIEDLGRRHYAYGVKADHYTTVGEALLWTLEMVLGPRFDDEARAAWTAAYQTIATHMQRS
jgi:hemoglobin-like flavoprotein